MTAGSMISSDRRAARLVVMILALAFLFPSGIFAAETPAKVVNAGKSRTALETTDAEISEWTRKIEQNPQDGTGYGKRGRAYINRGEFDKAIADCTKAIELLPSEGRNYLNRGWAYEKKRGHRPRDRRLFRRDPVQPERSLWL